MTSADELRLTLLPQTFFLVQFPLKDGVPRQIIEQLTRVETGPDAGFVSLTKTSDEISYVADAYPEGLGGSPSSWRCIKINGPLHHHLTGIMHDLTAPLKLAKVPIFAISTWGTDYVLVPHNLVDEAKRALEDGGWIFPAQS